jgi:TolB protein
LSKAPFVRNASSIRIVLTVIAFGIMVASAKAQTPAPPTINGGLPYVSPDGTQISFVAYRGALPPHLFVINADGTGEKQLTTDGAGPGHWLPDGNHLVYTFGSGRQDTSSILVIDSNGSSPHSFARLPGRDPTISPDGKWLLTSIGNFIDGKLWIVRQDGTGARQLTNGPGGDFNAAFSADGKQVAFTRLARVEGATRPVVTVWVVNTDGTGERVDRSHLGRGV